METSKHLLILSTTDTLITLKQQIIGEQTFTNINFTMINIYNWRGYFIK